MEVLRSKVAERPERDATIEGIYGSKGFFFQQRRGHLDLRGITNIDLEKVVREVDVDTLQLYIENITFCNLREEDLRYLTDPQVIKMFKMSQLIIEYLLYSQDLFVANLGELSKKYVSKKKSLAKKRRELAELEEATKHLRNQVKAKKQNITTLEDLLRENSRRAAHEPKPHPVEQPRQVRPEKISFYVAGPDGLCVEFSERPETSIFNLRKSVTQAFVSKKDTESDHYNKVVRLVHKGILMLDDRSIEYYGIKAGDTVVTVIEKGEAVAPAPVVQQQQPPAKENNLSEMIEFLSKQQDAMRQFANDIKYGWENALLTIKNNKDGDHNLEDSERRLLTKIDDKWNLFESGMKLQLEAKLNDYQALLLAQKAREEHLPNIQVVRRRPHVGELEDDNDGPALNDITDKLNQFGNQLNRLEVKTVHTDESVDDLRNMLRNRPTAAPAPVIINTTTTAAPVLGTKPVAKVEIVPPVHKSSEFKMVKNDGNAYNPHYNKWNHLDDGLGLKAASVVEEKKEARVALGSFEVPAVAAPVVQKAPEKVVEAPKVKSPPPKAKPAEKKVAARKEPAPKPVVEKKPTVKMVDVIFPAVYHTDDMAVFHGEKVLLVQLPETLAAEDVVFLLRKEIANKLKEPLTRVTLVLRGKSITLDVDADDEVLTVESVRSYAANGVLIFKVNKGKPMTNAQLDLLVPSWQRASRDDPASLTPSTGAASGSEGEEKKGGGSSKRFKKRRDWNDDEDVADDDPQMLSKNMYKTVRGSLDEALSGVSDREGLTDDELHQKMQSLKQFTESLPTTVSDHMRNFKGKVTKSITAASIDSGSEDFLPQTLSLRNGGGGGAGGGGGSDVGESNTLRRSRLLSVSRVGHLGSSPVPTLSESGGVRRSIEDFHAEEDFVGKYSQLKDDSPAMASVTNSVDMRSQFRSATSTRAEGKSMDSPLRGLGSTNSTTRSSTNRKDDAKLVNTTSTTDSLLYSPSQSISSNRPNNRYPTSSGAAVDVDSELDDDDDDEDQDDREYTTVSRVQQRGKSGGGGNNQVRASGEFGEGARIDKTMLSSINTLNTLGENSDGEHYDVMDEVDSDVGDFNDLSRTVDSEGDMLVKDHPVRSSAVRRKADDYERDAASGGTSSAAAGGGRGGVPRTPPHRDYNRDSPESKARYDNRTFSNASKGSNVSLFNNLQSGDMVDDFEDSVHSLAFSHNEDD